MTAKNGKVEKLFHSHLDVRESEAAISDTLRQRLGDQLSVGSQAVRGSREKTITLLLKTWVRVPSRIESLRDDAIRELGMFVAQSGFLSTGG